MIYIVNFVFFGLPVKHNMDDGPVGHTYEHIMDVLMMVVVEYFFFRLLSTTELMIYFLDQQKKYLKYWSLFFLVGWLIV